MFYTGVVIGFCIGTILGAYNMHSYKKILYRKGNNEDMSNVEYIFGKPYSIIKTEEALKMKLK